MSFGTPSSFGSWLRANTARVFTSVSGSFVMAPTIVSATRVAGLLGEPEQRLSADVRLRIVARRAEEQVERARLPC